MNTKWYRWNLTTVVSFENALFKFYIFIIQMLKTFFFYYCRLITFSNIGPKFYFFLKKP